MRSTYVAVSPRTEWPFEACKPLSKPEVDRLLHHDQRFYVRWGCHHCASIVTKDGVYRRISAKCRQHQSLIAEAS